MIHTRLLLLSVFFFTNLIFSMDYKHVGRINNGEPDRLVSMAISPDGNMLAACGTLHIYEGFSNSGKLKHTDSDALIRLWKVESGELVGDIKTKKLGPMNAAYSVGFSPDGATMAASGGSYTGLFSTETGETYQLIVAENRGGCRASFSSNNKLLIAQPGQVEIYQKDSSGSFFKRSQVSHLGPVKNVWTGPTRQMKLLFSNDLLLDQFPFGNGGKVQRREVSGIKLAHMSLDESHMSVLRGDGNDATITIEKVESEERVAELNCPGIEEVSGRNKEIASLALNSDGTRVAASRGAAIYLWNLMVSEKGKEAETESQPVELSATESGEVREIHFGSNGMVAALRVGGTIDIWREQK